MPENTVFVEETNLTAPAEKASRKGQGATNEGFSGIAEDGDPGFHSGQASCEWRDRQEESQRVVRSHPCDVDTRYDARRAASSL